MEFIYAMFDKELDKYFPVQQYSSDAACLRALKAVKLPPHLEDGVLQVFRLAKVDHGRLTVFEEPEVIWENSTQVKVGIPE